MFKDRSTAKFDQILVALAVKAGSLARGGAGSGPRSPASVAGRGVVSVSPARAGFCLESSAGQGPHNRSRTDGVVHWQSRADRSGSPRVDNIEVMSSHAGVALSAEVSKAIASRLVLCAN
jgi:hypothetical protein